MDVESIKKIAARLLKREARCVGLDIQGGRVRAVRMRRDEHGRPVLERWGSVDADALSEDAQMRAKLQSFLLEMSDGRMGVAIAVEHPTLRIRRMNLAPMPERDLLEAIRWNFREQVDCPIEQYTVGYSKLPGYDEGGLSALMAYGISEEAIREQVRQARSLGMKLISLEPVATALLAAFHANGALQPQKYCVCLSLGVQYTYFVVFTAGSVLFSRPLSAIDIISLHKLLARNLNCSLEDAQSLYRQWIAQAPAIGAEQQRLVDVSAKHFISQLAIEVQRSIDAFCIMYGLDSVDGIALCGDGIEVPQLAEHLQHALGIQTRPFSPFASLARDDGCPEVPGAVAAAYTTAVGLAIPF